MFKLEINRKGASEAAQLPDNPSKTLGHTVVSIVRFLCETRFKRRRVVRLRLTSRPRSLGRVSLSLGVSPIEGITYQMDSPIGLDLKLAKIAPEDTLKSRRSGTIPRGFSGVLLGPVLMALGSAL